MKDFFQRQLSFLHLFHFSPEFLLLLAWLNYLDQQNIIPMALFACVCHEWGHYLAILFCGGQVQGISFSLVGAEMALPSHFSYQQELFCTLAGPGMNLILAWVFSQVSPLFAGLNLALALLNLLPLSKLDGGRAMFCLWSLWLPMAWRHGLVMFCDVLFSAVVLVLGLLVLLGGGSVTLLILGLWLVQAISS